MLARCTHKCQFAGRSIKPGTVLEIAERDITDAVKASFAFDVPMKAVEPPKPPPVATLKDELTIPELKTRLAEMGVPFKARDTRDVLEALYLSAHEPQELKK